MSSNSAFDIYEVVSDLELDIEHFRCENERLREVVREVVRTVLVSRPLFTTEERHMKLLADISGVVAKLNVRSVSHE